MRTAGVSSVTLQRISSALLECMIAGSVKRSKLYCETSGLGKGIDWQTSDNSS